jgi:type I restriction enzyme S subunit
MKKGWEEIKMVDACEILTCGVASTPTYVDKQIGIPFLSAQNVRDGEVVLEKYSFISKEFHQKLTSKNKPSKGDILYSRVGAKYGEAGVVEHSFEFSVYVSVTLIRPKRELLNNYFLKYYLNSPRIKDLAKKSISSSGVPNLNVNSVRDFLVPIPPLTEQQRIVSILDEAFAKIEKAKFNAEQNLKNAKELFESYLQGVFENKGVDWEEKTLGEIADVEYGFTDKSTEEGDFRYIRITDIDKNGELILEDKKYINHSIEAEGFLIRDNDLLMARTGATFAKVLLYTGDEPSVFASYLIRIKFNEKIENALYWYFTKTKYYWKQANSLQSGAAQPHFNGAAVKQVIFSYPKSAKEQKVLIEKFETISLETKKLEANYQQKINDLEELQKSVLQKAFSGELKTVEVI